MTSQLDTARAALVAAREAEAEAQRTYHSLSADLSAAQQQAADARAAGDIARLAELSARIAAGRDITADAADVLRAKSAAVRRAAQDVADIETSAATMRGQIDDLSAKLDSPRNDWQKAIWRAEGDLRQAQQQLDRARTELQDAQERLAELRSRLSALEGES